MKTNDEKKNDARRLWEICFNDTKAFVDFYFNKVYKDQDTLVRYDENNNAIAHVQMLPYTLYAWGKDFEAGYISGACTKPENRKEGVMESLMKEAMVKMKERGEMISFLIPADEYLADYYDKVCSYGRVFFEKTATTLEEVMMAPAEQILPKGPIDFIMEAEECRSYPHVKHTREQIRLVMEDYKMSNGGMYTFPRNMDHPTGICFYRVEGDTLYVKDLFGSPSVRTEMLKELMTLNHCMRLKATVPTGDKTHAFPRGMLRILDIPEFTRHYALTHNNMTIGFKIRDRQMPENSGEYYISNGKLTFKSNLNQEEGISPAALARTLFSEDPGFLSLMME